jgi:hypothetical protein
MGPMLLNHLSAENAAQHGVSAQAEAVADDKHTLYLIAEARDAEQVTRFLAPYAQVAPSSCCLPPPARRSSTVMVVPRVPA